MSLPPQSSSGRRLIPRDGHIDRPSGDRHHRQADAVVPRFDPNADEKDEEAEAKLRHCRIGVMPRFMGYPEMGAR